MTKAARKTKLDLEREIADLKSQMRCMKNELAPFRVDDYKEYIPCGPVMDVGGHAFEDDIRDQVCNQYDGKTGWIRIEMDARYEHPLKMILVHVTYDEQDGTWASRFCQLARRTRKYDYDNKCWEEWKVER
jgi:hypothetical protein